MYLLTIQYSSIWISTLASDDLIKYILSLDKANQCFRINEKTKNLFFKSNKFAKIPEQFQGDDFTSYYCKL